MPWSFVCPWNIDDIGQLNLDGHLIQWLKVNVYSNYLNLRGAKPISSETHPKIDMATTFVVTKSMFISLKAKH